MAPIKVKSNYIGPDDISIKITTATLNKIIYFVFLEPNKHFISTHLSLF